MSRLNSMVAGSGAGVTAGAAGVPGGTDCAACITVAHSTSPRAPVHRETREILILPENLLIKSNPSEFDLGQGPVGIRRKVGSDDPHARDLQRLMIGPL